LCPKECQEHLSAGGKKMSISPRINTVVNFNEALYLSVLLSPLGNKATIYFIV
jgi:hypothetical protein